MRIAVIGAGNIGANAARHFAAAGHTVRIAGSGDMAKLAATGASVGAAPTGIADAVQESEIVMLALPWTARLSAFAQAGSGAFDGKIVIDAMNPYLEYPNVEDLHGRTSSEVVAAELPGGRVVKVLNTLYAERLANGARPAGSADRIALPVCGDDAGAKATVTALLDEIGFDAADAGPLSRSRPMEPGQPFYALSDTLPELRARLA